MKKLLKTLIPVLLLVGVFVIGVTTTDAAATFSQLGKGTATAAGGQFTITSLNPVANHLTIAAFGGTGPFQVSSVSGCNLNWQKTNGGTFGATTPPNITVWQATGTSPTTNCTLTALFGGSTQSYMIYDVAGVDSLAPVVQSAITGSATAVTTLSTTLSAYSNVNNVAMGFISAPAATSFTAGTSMTTLDTITTTPGLLVEKGTAAGTPTTVGATFSSSKAAVIAVELKVSPPNFAPWQFSDF